ncbi:MAG: hypothetical protein CO098_08015 [Bacteroidetes bacterium CG_4_9_14_3_um_filter_41_19]|nr:MAG: hypothetical protein CO098_08015 [Bacteroidetes bacterium CG_4_9_14_3_um_filter_41_19]
MSNHIIFIHVPKTGGTTLNTAMQQAYWQTKPDFYYRHILADTKESNAGDIFNPDNFKKYSHFDIMMMLRHPVDRAISEYYFMKERTEFMKLLQPIPNSFSEFINNPQTHNYVVSFLTGNKIYSKKRPQPKDLKQIITAIESLPIHVGIFEEFGKSLDLFSKETGVEWERKVEVKRMTFKRPRMEELSEELTNSILRFNSLDDELYNYCLEKFNAKKNALSAAKFKFDANKYNHVLPYMANYPFFEFCMENKEYLRKNIGYFKALTDYLIYVMKINDGRKLTRAFNATYLNSIKNHFPGSSFYSSILGAYNTEKEPINQTDAMAKAVDVFFLKNPKDSANYFKPMLFDELLVEMPKMEIKEIFNQFFLKKP